MQQPKRLDTRTILKAYGVAAFAGGLLLSALPWPTPEAVLTLHADPTRVWRLLMMLAGSVIVMSGLFAQKFASIEDPLARRGALRLLAFTILYLGIFRWAPAWPLMRVVPTALGAVPLVVGLVMLYLALDVPRRHTKVYVNPGTGLVLRERPSMVGRYEESIRQSARQEERARLARDLHDAVKQQLFVIQTAAATVEQRWTADPDGAHAALTQVPASARDALTEMEVMLEQLQATAITNAGLIESLRKQAEVLTFRTGAEVQFQPGSLPPEAAFAPGAHQAMLRFVQEALANVARHARASHVTIALRREQKQVVLSVTDDGQGFDPKRPPTGMGLVSMSARAAEADGVYSIRSAPGEGTTVSLTIQPYSPDRSGFMRWIIGSALMIAGLAYLGFTTPASLVYVMVGLLVCGTVLVDNAMAWWRAREWP